MKKFSKFICLIFVCIFGLSCVGCAGNDPESMLIPLYGTKVLYRPEHYDYDTNSGNAGYFGQYAWQILGTLNQLYGAINNEAFLEYEQNSETHIGHETEVTNESELNTSKKDYFYDSIRYDIFQTESTTVNRYIGDEESNLLDGSIQYFKVIVNENNGWNWRFNYKSEPLSILADPFISMNKLDDTSSSQVSNLFAQTYAIGSDEPINSYFENLSTHYDIVSNKYTTAFLGASTQTDFDSYSDFVKALEYVIYCMSMEIEPRAISVTNQDSITGPTVTITGFSNLDSALSYIKDVFAKRGTVVGITPNKQKRLAKYILNNVIGLNAINNDVVKEREVEINEYYQSLDDVLNGTPTRVQTNVIQENSISIYRNYEQVVYAVVKNVCDKVNLGTGEGEDSENISDYFASSEIIDYNYNYFSIGSTARHEFDHIPSLEYQSICMMFSANVEFDNLCLFFKYDAGDDGDETISAIDPNASITIRTYLNFYSPRYGYVNNFRDQEITVPDGRFNYGASTHTVLFDGLSVDKGYGLQFRPFNRDIGEGALRTIPTLLNPYLSVPIPLAGGAAAKDYYKLVASDTEELGSSYYSYGILNEEKFIEADCDFFEIAFEVIKATGKDDQALQNGKNYKFQVGMGFVTTVNR